MIQRQYNVLLSIGNIFPPYFFVDVQPGQGEGEKNVAVVVWHNNNNKKV